MDQMTPDAWFAATDPNPLLELVDPPARLVDGAWQAPPPRPAPIYRRLRLFATGCVRMVWQFLPTDARSAVAISERYAEGKATEADLLAAGVRYTFGVTFKDHAVNAAGLASCQSQPHGQPEEVIRLFPRETSHRVARAIATHAAGPAGGVRIVPQSWHAVWNAAYLAARGVQAEIARAVFPPPGEPTRLDGGWLTSTVDSLARHIDSTGDFTLVPILADALQDAGCGSEPVLECCRARGASFARGNWVVDFVLGR